MAQGDIYGTRTQFRSKGRVWTVNLYYKDDTGLPELDAANDLAVASNTTLGPLFDAARAADTTREGTYAWKITAGTGMPDKVSDASVPGGITGQALPPNTCIVYSLKTNDPAAKRNGRIYLAGIAHSEVTNGQITDITDAKYENIRTQLQQILSGAAGTWQPVILRRVLNGAPLVPPVGSDVSSCSVSAILYSQRRRNSRQIGSAP